MLVAVKICAQPGPTMTTLREVAIFVVDIVYFSAVFALF